MAHMPEARCTYASLSRPPAYCCARLDTSLWLPVFSPLALLRGFGFFTPTCSLACAASLALVSFAARTMHKLHARKVLTSELVEG